MRLDRLSTGQWIVLLVIAFFIMAIGPLNLLLILLLLMAQAVWVSVVSGVLVLLGLLGWGAFHYARRF